MRRPLGGQSQKEAADKPAGQDDVPLYEICRLQRRDEGKVKSELTKQNRPQHLETSDLVCLEPAVSQLLGVVARRVH